MPAFDIVVFDLDGTLADTVPDLTDAINVMLDAKNLRTLNADEVRSMLGDGVKELVRRALDASGGASTIDFGAAFPVFFDYYAAHLADKSRAWPGAQDALLQLKAAGVSLALCTNKVEQLTGPFLTQMGWDEMFNSIVCGDTLKTRKPDPAPLIEAVRKAGGGRALFVGDTEVDLATAQAADIPCVIVDIDGLWALEARSRTLPGHTVISKFEELLAIVLAN